VTSSDIDREAVLFLSPGDPERTQIREDPYPFYERLRERAPVYKTAAGPWLLTDQSTISAFLRDNDWSREDHPPATPPPPRRRPQEILHATMLFRDDPEHLRLRRLVNKAFLPAGIETWRLRIDALTTDLVSRLLGRESFDLVAEYAFRIPLTIICEMLGVPLNKSAEFARWAELIVESLEPSMQSEQARAEQDAAAAAAQTYFSEMVEARRAEPGDDIISALLEVEREEKVPVTTHEIVSMCVLLHIAGHDTTGHLIASAIYHLWSRPDQLELIEHDRSLVPGAIEEVLRYDAPARNSTPRRAWVDKQIEGHHVPAGDVVYGILGAADRDPSKFDAPHRFDVTRANNKHIAFGVGTHYCLGAVLARAESVSAINALLSADRRLVLDPEVVWRDSFTIRGLQTLRGSWAERKTRPSADDSNSRHDAV
jgi:cytochrome P450